jgi:hypothetical protein
MLIQGIGLKVLSLTSWPAFSIFRKFYERFDRVLVYGGHYLDNVPGCSYGRSCMGLSFYPILRPSLRHVINTCPLLDKKSSYTLRNKGSSGVFHQNITNP